jgi:hypothetical protein
MRCLLNRGPRIGVFSLEGVLIMAMSHKLCDHPATPAGRAACRRAGITPAADTTNLLVTPFGQALSSSVSADRTPTETSPRRTTSRRSRRTQSSRDRFTNTLILLSRALDQEVEKFITVTHAVPGLGDVPVDTLIRLTRVGDDAIEGLDHEDNEMVFPYDIIHTIEI